MSRLTLPRILLPLALFTLTGPAFAQKNDTAEPGYSYQFETDFVDGDDLFGDGPILRVLGPHARVLLIRPRTSFVAELIQATENL